MRSRTNLSAVNVDSNTGALDYDATVVLMGGARKGVSANQTKCTLGAAHMTAWHPLPSYQGSNSREKHHKLSSMVMKLQQALAYEKPTGLGVRES